MKKLTNLVVFSICIGGTILSGVVFMHLWLWFVVPVFKVPPLNIPQAIGLMTCIRFMLHRIRKIDASSTETAEKQIADAIARNILYPAIVLVMGLIVTLFL